VALVVVNLFVGTRSAAVVVFFMKVALWWMELRRPGCWLKEAGRLALGQSSSGEWGGAWQNHVGHSAVIKDSHEK
jgi:hypothetical protein